MTKKRLIKPLALALGGALFMVCAVNAAAESSVTLEGTGSTTSVGDSFYRATIDEGLTTSPAEITVQAQVSGGPEIVYNVQISWGTMLFQYDYGKTWNPQTHSYTGNSAGGWNAARLNGDNNSITVTNHSNYPMKIGFDFEPGTALNTDKTQDGSVIGIFSEDNASFTADILRKGKNIYGGGNTTATLNLEMDTTNLGHDDFYYATRTTVTPTAAAAAYYKNMYFALAGRPDPGITTLSSPGEVGTIKVTVEPYNDAALKFNN